MAKVKNRKSNKISISQLDKISDPIKTLIMAIIMLVILVPVMLLVFNIFDNHKSGSKVEFDTDKIWEEAFRGVEESRVGIIFDTISTSEQQYDKLRLACNEIVDNESNKSDISVDVDVIVNEPIYIDNNSGNILKNNIEKTDSLVETGPIYFNDMLMIRYINEHGDMRVIASAFEDSEKTKTIVLNQSDIADSKHVQRYSDTTSSLENVEDTDQNNSNTISEKEYIGEISNCISEMLSPKYSIQDYINTTTKYFTTDGKDSVISGKNSLELNNSDSIDLIYSAAGKSDTSRNIKDRIYLQYSINNDKLINIVVKLNHNLKIFDIDII